MVFLLQKIYVYSIKPCRTNYLFLDNRRYLQEELNDIMAAENFRDELDDGRLIVIANFKDCLRREIHMHRHHLLI